MEIKDIMRRLDESQQLDESVKTAAATPNSEPPTNPDTLHDALRKALAAAPSQTKTAAAPQPSQNPAGDLLKMAEDLTNAEEQAMKKLASVLGTAMCDGFMEKFAQYEEAALEVSSKTAAQQTGTWDADLEAIKTAAANDTEFQKFASENPDLVKEAVDLGYRQTWDQLVKTAEDDFQRGYADATTEMHKMASECYKQGALTINSVLQQLQNQAA